MMRIGIRGHDFGPGSPEELAERYAALGIQAVQLAIPKAVAGVASYAGVSDRLLAAISDSFRAAGVCVAVLGCYIDPALPDAGARAAQLAEFERGAYCAAALGAGCVATETTAYSGGEEGRERQLGLLFESLERMMAAAQRHGAKVAVEPVALHTMNTPALMRRAMREFEGIGAIFDPVNLLTPQNIGAQDELWREAIECFGAETQAMHIKDVRLARPAGRAGEAGKAGEAGEAGKAGAAGAAGEACAASGKGAEGGEAGGSDPAAAALSDCLLGDGIVDYAARIAPWLKEQMGGIARLRVGVDWDTASRDLEYMRRAFLA
ncbi:MAG: sugar phosphate isomerase/epimerase [Clostridiales bacterium]|jgi:sugar phosphate isomerase/epimerase|nr:sugar phosphate isomerase/epimerase [Clostridiales bacterium]